MLNNSAIRLNFRDFQPINDADNFSGKLIDFFNQYV